MKLKKKFRRQEINKFISEMSVMPLHNYSLEIRKFILKMPTICSNEGYAIHSGAYFERLRVYIQDTTKKFITNQLEEIFELAEKKLNIEYTNEELFDISKYLVNIAQANIELAKNEICKLEKTDSESMRGSKYDFYNDLETFSKNINNSIDREIRIYRLRIQLKEDEQEVKLSKRAFVLSLIAIIFSVLVPLGQFIYNAINNVIQVKIIN